MTSPRFDPEEEIPRRIDEYQRLQREGRAPTLGQFLTSQPAELRRELAEFFADDAFIDEQFGEFGLSLHPGQIVGDFRLVEQIGHGGMGVVWRAEQISLGRQVAIKFLEPRFGESRQLSRLEREARAGGRLSHPAIVQVHAFGSVDGLHYIVQELVSGGATLASRIKRDRDAESLPDGYYRDTAELFAKIAEAIGYAHDEGVVHRDVKPGNVLITETGEPKLVDFGLAMVADDLTVSRTGDFQGTPHYMSPEQVMSKRIGIDKRTDIFSLGSTLYEALTLTRAFDGDVLQQVLEKITMDDPPDPRRVRSKVPRDLAVICMKAIEKKRERRFASMADFAQDLRRFLANEPIVATPPGPLTRTLKWAHRHPIVSSGSAIAAVAMVVITSLLLVVQRRNAELLELSHELDLELLFERARKVERMHPTNEDEFEELLADADALLARLPSLRRNLERIDSAPAPLMGREWTKVTLERLIAGLEQLGDPDLGLKSGLSPEHGWGIERRRDFVRSIPWDTLESPEARERWAEAQKSISNSAVYGHRLLAPQLGLLPIHRDPRSGLWEFWVYGTGSEPRVVDGEVEMTEASGLVMILVPSGPFLMGDAGPPIPADQRVQRAVLMERPATNVNLDWYFLSKYEISQAQWVRLTGENPSMYYAGKEAVAAEYEAFTALHPVEQVSCNQAIRVLGWLGLALPTEAQWEKAARAGTPWPWWSGDSGSSLETNENICDQDAFLFLAPTEWPAMSWHDGWPAHAPIGIFKPNPFGFYDMCGNVFEWTSERPTVYSQYQPSAGDGRRDPEPADKIDATQRVQRGGSWRFPAMLARVSYRYPRAPETMAAAVGVRPARPVLGE